jgi:hypothetical protein
MKQRQYVGLSILIAVAMLIVYVQGVRPNNNDAGTHYKPLTISGMVGGKLAFFDDPAVITYLKEEYNLTVKATRVGSFEQVERCRPPEEFCWPSSQIAGELLAERLNMPNSSQIIFNSPIVLYSWAPIVDALITHGIVAKQGETYFVTDFLRLAQMVNGKSTWADLGLSAPFGSMQILTTDPIESNTGNAFTGLLANTFNGGAVVDETTVDPVIPEVQTFVGGMGLLAGTTTQLFEQYVNLGMGGAPMIVAYESNLIEYSLQHPDSNIQQRIQNDLRMLYPSPTVWSEQPFIPLTDGGKRLMEALRSPEMQRIGWENHGFRPGNPSVLASTEKVAHLGVVPSVDSVIRMPSADAMVRIMDALRSQALLAPRRTVLGA